MSNRSSPLSVPFKRFVVCVVCFALLISGLSSCHTSQVNETNYDKIKNGMTLTQVEAILGPGQSIPQVEVPTTTGGIPFVRGDEVHCWKDGETGSRILLGFSSGRVSDRSYWEPSL